VGSSNRLLGWMGMVLLLGILPIKLARFEQHGASSFAIGVAPSVLGAAGLLFLLLSSTGRLARLSLLRVTVLVAALSVTLELLQLLPRPGVLARIHYTFDTFDLAGTVLGVAMAYMVSAWILRPSPRAADGGSSDQHRAMR
jgi:hypothetical protein